MSTKAERAALEPAVKEAIQLAAGDNRDAAVYLRIMGQATRMLDDLQDGDAGPVDVGWLSHILLVALPANPFFATHAAYLIPLHDTGVNAWQDANEMDPDGHLTASKFWAGWLIELFPIVAGIVGGYAHRRKVSPQIRKLLTPGWDEPDYEAITVKEEEIAL
jgi:hypothetical protein